MRLKFSLTTQELANLYVFNAWSAPWRKPNRQRIRFMIPAALGLLGISFIVRGDTESYVAGFLLLIIGVFWMSFCEKIYTARLTNFAKGFYNHEVNQRFWTEHSYDFRDSHIHIKNEYVDATLQWKAIINVIEQDDAYWLFETLTTAHIIPKRVLSGLEERRLRQLLSRYLQATEPS
jgi:hypothetical protein